MAPFSGLFLAKVMDLELSMSRYIYPEEHCILVIQPKFHAKHTFIIEVSFAFQVFICSSFMWDNVCTLSHRVGQSAFCAWISLMQVWWTHHGVWSDHCLPFRSHPSLSRRGVAELKQHCVLFACFPLGTFATPPPSALPRLNERMTSCLSLPGLLGSSRDWSHWHYL